MQNFMNFRIRADKVFKDPEYLGNAPSDKLQDTDRWFNMSQH